jgi:Flp pilus assembly protein TadG
VRIAKGQSLLEATFGLVFMVLIGIGLVDLAVVIYGVSLNDIACRNAARAAAAGAVNEAAQRAQVAIDQSRTNAFGTIISQPTLVLPVEIKLTSRPLDRRDPETDKLFSPGGLITGTVKVMTKVEVRPLAMECIFWRHDPFTFQAMQTFPIHCIVPASQIGLSPPAHS